MATTATIAISAKLTNAGNGSRFIWSIFTQRFQRFISESNCMSQFTVFVTRQLPVSLEPLEHIAQVNVWTERQPPPMTLLLERAIASDGILCLLSDPIDAVLIHSAPSLKVISQMAVGYDNIDIKAATQRGIPVGHTPGVLTNATADLTWALLMAAARRVLEGDRLIRSGRWVTWEPDGLLGLDLAGSTLGIVGLGRIGQAVARRALGFDMQILYTSSTPKSSELERSLNAKRVTFDQLLAASDIVTVHTPLTPDTYRLFGDRQFQQMKPSALFINTARGGIVDQSALYQALSTQTIAAAAIDVTDPEPIDMTSPLLSLNNLIMTPHIGSASHNTRHRMAQMAIANLMAGLQSQRLPHCANPQVYEAIR